MKKILALVLALTLALGTFSFAAAAPEDVVGEDCEDAVARLGALDIIHGFEDGTYRPDEPVTRAQFAKIIVSALGIGEAAEYAAGATKFPDVPADHWASGYVNVAVDVGVIAGYPDGTFQPENQVTFAEAIKMIVAGLGYTPKAEAMGGYPGGYLAVAAEEEITDGVNVVGTLAANRGAVAMMVDNSLEVDLMEQTSYGDKPTWEAVEGKTLLKTKLGVEEVKGTVIAISKTEKLDENEFELEDEDGNIETYEMVIDVNTESLFLKEVKILHKDEEVVWVSVETSEKDILFDTVVTFEDDEIELKVADKTYAWLEDDIEDATIYVNYEAYDDEDLTDMYGYFIFDGKEVMAANLFDFADKGFVTEVEDDEVEYIALEDAEEQVLILDDYDEVFVYNSDFTAADLEDIDEDTVMFYWEGDDDELFVMVANDVVEGEVTRLRDDRVTIDGENYKRAKDVSIVSLDEGDDYDTWDDAADYDIMGEEVILYLDLNGEIAAMVTAAEVTSDTQYGIVTWYYEGRNPSVLIFTSEDEEVEYYFDERADAIEAFEDNEYPYPNDNETVWAIKYELNSDGEIAEGTIEVIEEGDLVVTKKSDKKYVEDNGNIYFIDEDTVLMKALDDGELDPELVDYEALVDMEFTEYGEAIIFGDPDKTADLIVFTNTNFEGTKDDVYFGVVTDDPWKVGDDWFVEIDVFDEGKDDYMIASRDRNEIGEGVLIAFTLKSNDEVRVIDADDYDAKDIIYKADVVDDRDGSYLEVDGDDYRVASGAVLYQLDDDGDLDGTIRLSRIREGYGIEFLYDDDERELVAGLVYAEEKDPKEKDPKVETDGTVTYIDGTQAADDSFKIEVEGKVYVVTNSTVLRNELGIIEKSTADDVFARLNALTAPQVFDIVANSENVISSFKYNAEATDKAEAKKVIDAINALATSTDLATDVPAARLLYSAADGTGFGSIATTVEIQNLVPASVLAKLVAEETKLANADAAQDVADDKAALTIAGDLANVTSDLTLATAGTSTNTTITWKSSNTDVVSDATATLGKVTPPSFETGDVEVTLTATITSDVNATIKATKEFKVTVKKAAQTDLSKATEVANAIAITFATGDSAASVTQDLTLPTTTTTPHASTIVWESNKTATIDVTTTLGTGAVVRSAGQDEVVTLTAKVTVGSTATVNKTFTVTVKGL